MQTDQKIKDAVSRIRFPKKFEALFKPEKSRYRIFYGGRGGAKSWCFARALLAKGTKDPLRILCAREFQTSIKDSVHKLLSDQIYELGMESFYEITQTSIRGINGTEFIFVGIKNNTNNVKSIEGIDICWVEEAQSVSANSWNVLIPTIRKQDSEIWVSFNPELPTDDTWKRFVENPPESAVVVKVNWNDNPWFPETLNLERLSLQSRDMAAYNNVWEGMTRNTIDGAIFAKEMDQAEMDGRITNVPYDPSKPCHAVFDLGWADNTACWIIQFVGFEIRVLRYFEDNQKTIQHYLALMQTFGYIYDTIWLPHDAAAKSLGTGKVAQFHSFFSHLSIGSLLCKANILPTHHQIALFILKILKILEVFIRSHSAKANIIPNCYRHFLSATINHFARAYRYNSSHIVFFFVFDN